MSNVNKVILIGRLGKDPEVFNFESGKKVAFPLATSEYYYDKESKKREITEWHNIVMWRSMAEVAEKYLRKGSLVYLEGKIRTRSWDDKETSQKRYITEIQVDNMTMLGGSRDNRQDEPQNVENTASPDDEENDLPF